MANTTSSVLSRKLDAVKHAIELIASHHRNTICMETDPLTFPLTDEYTLELYYHTDHNYAGDETLYVYVMKDGKHVSSKEDPNALFIEVSALELVMGSPEAIRKWCLTFPDSDFSEEEIAEREEHVQDVYTEYCLLRDSMSKS